MTIAIVVYDGSMPVVYRMLTLKAYDRQQRTDQKDQDTAQPQGGTDSLCLGRGQELLP